MSCLRVHAHTTSTSTQHRRSKAAPYFWFSCVFHFFVSFLKREGRPFVSWVSLFSCVFCARSFFACCSSFSFLRFLFAFCCFPAIFQFDCCVFLVFFSLFRFGANRVHFFRFLFRFVFAFAVSFALFRFWLCCFCFRFLFPQTVWSH